MQLNFKNVCTKLRHLIMKRLHHCKRTHGNGQPRKYRGLLMGVTPPPPQVFIQLKNSEAVGKSSLFGKSASYIAFPKRLEFSDCHSRLPLSGCHAICRCFLLLNFPTELIFSDYWAFLLMFQLMFYVQLRYKF